MSSVTRAASKSARAILASSTNTTTTTSTLAASATRQFSNSRTALSGGDQHESHYDPPTGWLWGRNPNEKREREGWERVWYIGFYGGLGAAAVAYAFKPDTSIETWALEEAKRRLQADGTLPEDE